MDQQFNFKHYINKTLKEDFKIKRLNEIQIKTLNSQLQHKNVIGISATGSGKTLAFVLPLLQQIDLTKKIQSVIIAPTRELARQIYQVINSFKKNEKQLRVQLFVGGSEYEKQIKNIQVSNPHILIATVDRLKKAIIHKQLNFNDLFNITIDEADMLSDLGFINDLEFIINYLNVDKQCQITCWSASLHDLLITKLKKILLNPIVKQIGNSIYENTKITHHIIINNDEKQALNILIKQLNPYLCIVFANTKKNVEETYRFLRNNNLNVAMLHANLSSRERKNIFNKIKHFDYQYIIASDLASRGIDIDGVSEVISLGFPSEIEWYIHRSGRCGRGKYNGNAWTIANENEMQKCNNLRQKGIKFNFYKIKNNKLIKVKYEPNQKNYQLDDEAKNALKQLSEKKNIKKIKPNYKKKQKEELKKIYQKSKRRYLDKQIKQRLNDKNR